MAVLLQFAILNLHPVEVAFLRNVISNVRSFSPRSFLPNYQTQAYKP